MQIDLILTVFILHNVKQAAYSHFTLKQQQHQKLSENPGIVEEKGNKYLSLRAKGLFNSLMHFQVCRHASKSYFDKSDK